MDVPTQILAYLVAIGALTIAGYVLNLRGGHAELVRLCKFAWVGVLLGLSFGHVAESHASDFSGWVVRQTFLPDWFQEFVHTHSTDMDYAPVSGMAFGLGLAVLLWWFRRKTDIRK
jgi:hypothetical protein